MTKLLARAGWCLLCGAMFAPPLLAADPSGSGGGSPSGAPGLLPPDEARPLKWGPRTPVSPPSAVGSGDEESEASGEDSVPRWQPPRTSSMRRSRPNSTATPPNAPPRQASNAAADSRPVDRSARRASAEGAVGGADALIAQAYERSTKARDEAGFTETIEACQDALQAGPSPKASGYARRLMAWAHNKRGEIRLAEGKDSSALEDFEAAVDVDKTCWRAWHNRGVSYAALGRTREAVDDFGRTIELSRDFGMAYFNRGETRCELGDFASALEDYAIAARLMPEDVAVYNSRGYAHYRLRQLNEAAADYDKALALDPKNATAYLNRGDVYAETGAYAEASSDYRQAMSLDRKLGRAYQSVAWLMATCPVDEFRNGDLAVKAAERAIALDGRDDYRYLATLAAAHACQGAFAEAQRFQQEAIRIAPDEARALQERRLALYRSEKPYFTPRHEELTNRQPVSNGRR